MRTRYLAAPTFALLAAGLLAACGGGGGGSGTVAPATPTPSPTPVSVSCTSSVARQAAAASSLAGSGASFATASVPLTRRPLLRGGGGIVPDQLYVTYRPSAGARSVESAERSVAVVRAVDIATVSGQTIRAITLPSGSDLTAAAASLRQSSDVADVSNVHYRKLSSDPTAGGNDPYFENVDQWYLYKTNVVKNALSSGAWNLSTGCSRVSVAVIDTGVDLSGNDTLDFAVDYAEKVLNGVVTTGNAAVQDTNGHGTNTAGLATALANNGYGFAGVGFSTHLQVYKIFPDATSSSDKQSASTSDEARAISDAVAHGASVISLSIGSAQSQGADTGEQAAIASAIANGVTVVAANGNEYPTADGQQPDYPAGYPGVIAVGASAVQNTIANSYGSITAEVVASYSNSGPTLVAPGGDATTNTDNDILHWIEGYSTTTAAYPPDKCSNSGTPPTCRVLFNGTSQATPQVAGMVALMQAYHGGPRSLTPAQVTSILTSTADSIGQPASRQGAGRVNAGRAVAAAHP